MPSYNYEVDPYLYIKRIAGGKWIDFVRQIMNYIDYSDREHIKWSLTTDTFVLHIQDETIYQVLVSATDYICENSELESVVFDWTCRSQLPRILEWNNLSSSYEHLLNLRD